MCQKPFQKNLSNSAKSSPLDKKFHYPGEIAPEAFGFRPLIAEGYGSRSG
jgi:hypothetical protein